MNPPIHIRFTDEDRKLIAKLKKHTGLTTPGILRLALRVLYRRELETEALRRVARVAREVCFRGLLDDRHKDTWNLHGKLESALEKLEEGGF